MKKHALFILQILFFCSGVFIVAFGKVLMIFSDLGTDPWNVFHLGIARFVPLTVGEIVQVVGAIMLLIGWALKIRPTLGTFGNMYLLGFFIDFILDRSFIRQPQSPLVAWIYLILGVLICGFGFGMYLNANLGAGPRDSLMLGIVKVTGKSAGKIKTFMEGMAVFVGWLLGGPVGAGTIVYTIFIGAVMQWSLVHIKIPKFQQTLSSNNRG